MLYASSGSGSPGHLAAVLLESMTGVKMTHVPYKGGGPAIIDLVAGHVPSFFAVISTAVPHVRSGKIRAIAVTGAKRAEALPNVPTVDESGVKGYAATNWYGMLAPAATPAPIIERLNRDMNAALKAPDVVGIPQGQRHRRRTVDARRVRPLHPRRAEEVDADHQEVEHQSGVKGAAMSEHVYKHIELTGSSQKSMQDAIENAVQRASKTLRGMQWFKVTDTRGHIENGKIAHWQVTINVGFTLEVGRRAPGAGVTSVTSAAVTLLLTRLTV